MTQLPTQQTHSGPSIVAIVPTMGRSDLLDRCLAALKSQEGVEAEIVLVSQGSELPATCRSLATRVIDLKQNRGFAAACNLAIQETDAPLIAIVNDDAIVEPTWLASLSNQLAKNLRTGSAQGMNLSLTRPGRIDGCGIAWNRFWRPVQLGQGAHPTAAGDQVRPVLGVSATAALYRREALATLDGPDVFDPRLVSYYEDVELSIRLHRAGFTALFVPQARASHFGGATSRTLARQSEFLRFRNRYLVLAQLSGECFRRRAILLCSRDLLSIAAMTLSGRFADALGAGQGMLAIFKALSFYRHGGGSIDSQTDLPVTTRRAASWPSQWTT